MVLDLHWEESYERMTPFFQSEALKRSLKAGEKDEGQAARRKRDWRGHIHTFKTEDLPSQLSVSRMPNRAIKDSCRVL